MTTLKPFIRPPPPCFDYKTAVLAETRSTVATTHPELMDLVQAGSLVLVQKRRFGPVPEWRRWFVEPEMIWILGTSHLSEKSAIDAEQVVRAVRPDNVVVELCRSRLKPMKLTRVFAEFHFRVGIMYASADDQNAPLLNSNMFSLSGPQFLGTISRSINLGGQSALALRLLLAVFSSKITSGTNQTFGDEFRAARKAAEGVGAQLVLGDRPIEITLQRAWNSLNWNEKLGFVTLLFRGITSPSLKSQVGDLETEEEGGSPFELFDQLSNTYPSLLHPLIHERDTYLAWSLKRSKAVNNCKKVVGVIGKGHMNGVVYSLMADQGDLRFSDLVGRTSENSNSWVKSLVKGLIRDTIIGVALWALYELLQKAL